MLEIPPNTELHPLLTTGARRTQEVSLLLHPWPNSSLWPLSGGSHAHPFPASTRRQAWKMWGEVAEKRLKEERTCQSRAYKPRVGSCTSEVEVLAGAWKMSQTRPLQISPFSFHFSPDLRSHWICWNNSTKLTNSLLPPSSKMCHLKIEFASCS